MIAKQTNIPAALASVPIENSRLDHGFQPLGLYRNGTEIGRARLTITGDTPLVDHALVLSVDPNAVARIKMPADFADRINGILAPGATLVVTNEALYPQKTGPTSQVVDADPPARGQPVHSSRSESFPSS